MNWTLVDVTARSGFTPSAISQTKLLGFAYNATQRLYFRGADDHVNELVNGDPRSSTWTVNDLMVQATCPASANAATSPVGYLFRTQNTAHVFYRGYDSHIYELDYSIGSWHCNDLTAGTQAPPVLSSTDYTRLSACSWESVSSSLILS